MTRRRRPDDGFIYLFARWRPVAPAPGRFAPTCIGCGCTESAELAELHRSGWHVGDGRHLCGACSRREAS